MGGSALAPTNVDYLPPGSNVWQTGSPLDIARVGLGAELLPSGKILAYGGASPQAIDAALLYDTTIGDLNDTQDGAIMHSARAFFGFASDADFAYAIGGKDDSGIVLASAERYNSATDKWTVIAPLPQARVGSEAVADGLGHIFVFGGASTAIASTTSSTVFQYTVATNTWTTVAPLPIGVRESAATLASNGKIYVVGGLTTTDTTAAVQTYDPVLNQWTVDVSLPTPISGAAVVSDSLGRLQVLGGKNAAGARLASVYVSQRLDQPDVAPAFTSSPVLKASTDLAYSYQVSATGNPQPVYSLPTAPAGMTVNSVGLVTWQPKASQVGNVRVTIRATNAAGFVEQAFTIATVLETTPPTAPTNLSATSISTTTAQLSWTASSDNTAVKSYSLFEVRRTGFHGIHTTYSVIQSNIIGTTTTVTGLTPGSTKNYAVAAFDGSGNKSLYSNHLSVTQWLAPTYVSPSTALNFTAKHPLSFTVSANGTPSPTLSLISRPRGLTFDSLTKTVSWTPPSTAAGAVPIVIKAQNAAGVFLQTLTLTIIPDAPVLSYVLNPTTGPAYAVAGSPVSFQVNDSSLTHSTYSLVSKPTGMTINVNTGIATWTPTLADSGLVNVTVRATNICGTKDIIVPITVYFTGSVSTISQTNPGSSTPTLQWVAPSSTAPVTSYQVTASYTTGAGRFRRTVTFNFSTTTNSPTATLTGLNLGHVYRVTVRAVDAVGKFGVSSTVFSMTV